MKQLFLLFAVLIPHSVPSEYAYEGDLCGGFQQVRCARGLTCLFFDPSRVIDRQGVCVQSFF